MYRKTYVALGGPLTPAVKFLLIATTALYVVELITFNWLNYGFMIEEFSFTQQFVVQKFKFWQFFTYMFIHDPRDPSHLLFNLLGLWLFGGVFEERWGTKDFFRFYFLSGTGAGFFVMLTSLIDRDQWFLPTLGASGAIYALLMAYGMKFPDSPVYFFGIFPIKGKHLILILVGITTLLALARSPASYSAHFGGLGMGYLLISGNWRPSKAVLRLRLKYSEWLVKRKRRKMGLVWKDKDDTGKYVH